MPESPWLKSKEYLAYQWYLAVGGTAGAANESTWQKPLAYWLWQIYLIYGGTATDYNLPVNYWLWQIYNLLAGPIVIAPGEVPWSKSEEYLAYLIYNDLASVLPPTDNSSPWLKSLEYWLYWIGQTATPPSYIARVLGIQPANLVAYWPLNEPAGAVADNAEGTAARDGAYSNVTLAQPGIGDGNTSPLFNGTTSYLDIYSASLSGTFGGKGTFACWFKVLNAGVWSDGVNRNVIRIQSASVSDFIIIYKSTSADDMQWMIRMGGGGFIGPVAITINDTNWVHLAITWDDVANETKFYINGVQQGVTQLAPGIFLGPLSATESTIGAYNTAAVQDVWSGFLAHPAFWTIALTAPELVSLATP